MEPERIDSREVWRGEMVALRVERFRTPDGAQFEREIVTHPGAVAIAAHDGERIYLVRQRREAVGEDALLELPAGKLESGEEAHETAERELAEEIGKRARSWTKLTTFYSSPGFSDEVVHLYLATDLYDAPAKADENEEIEVEAIPLSRLDDAISTCRDAKSLVGLLWLRASTGAGA